MRHLGSRKLVSLGLSLPLAVALLGAGCSDDEGSVTGTTIATQMVTIGQVPVSVTLVGKGKNAVVDFPVGVTRVAVPLTVNLNDGVRKGAAQVGGPVVEIVNPPQFPGLVFESSAPAKMRQQLPPPPAGKRYLTVTATREAPVWTVVPRAPRVVSGVGAPPTNGGVDAGVPLRGADAGGFGGPVAQPQVAEAATQNLTYEIDVTGPGYWGIAYEVPLPADPAVAGTCANALNKLRGCGFTFMPAGTDPCSDVMMEDLCGIKCIANAGCPQLSSLFCATTEPNLNDPFFMCFLQCQGSDQTLQCGDGGTYSSQDKCDGFDDCGNMADEAGCPQFACGDGTMIRESGKCDGLRECANGADEAGCPPAGTDEGSDLYCPNGQRAGFEGSADMPPDTSPPPSGGGGTTDQP